MLIRKVYLLVFATSEVFVWPRGIKSTCCPAWRLPPLTTHPRIVFSSLRDTHNVLSFLIMYDGMEAYKDRSRKNVEQDHHRNIQQQKSKNSDKNSDKKNKNSIKKIKIATKKCNPINFRTRQSVSPDSIKFHPVVAILMLSKIKHQIASKPR
jgi:hypothetical protein